MWTSKAVVCNFCFLVIVNSAIAGARIAFLNTRMSDQWSPQTAHLYGYTSFVMNKNAHFNKTNRNN